MRRYISPEHRSGLILFVDQLPFGRDMCPEKLIDATRDGLAEDGGVVKQQPDVLIVVEEGGLDEDGGHGCAPQDSEVGVNLDAAVRECPVDAADGPVQGLLHDGREAMAPRALAERIRLAAAAAAGVGMDREEDIGRPVVGERCDIRVGGRLAAQVVALHRLRRVAVALERDAAVLCDARIDLGFRDIVFEIDRAGVRPAAERMARIDKDSHGMLLSYRGDLRNEDGLAHSIHFPSYYNRSYEADSGGVPELSVSLSDFTSSLASLDSFAACLAFQTATGPAA